MYDFVISFELVASVLMVVSALRLQLLATSGLIFDFDSLLVTRLLPMETRGLTLETVIGSGLLLVMMMLMTSPPMVAALVVVSSLD